MNNQKQFSLALLNYESGRRAFPGYEATVNDRQVCWLVQLFPYLERNDLWSEWSEGTGTAVFLRMAICPSDPPEQTSAGSAPLAYVVNAGLTDNFSDSAMNTYVVADDGSATGDVRLSEFFRPTPSESELSKPSGGAAVERRACNGVCHYQLTDAPASRQGVRVSMDYISSHDGAHATLLLSERLRTDTADVNWKEAYWAINPETFSTKTSPEKYWGFCWRWADDDDDMADAKLTDHVSSFHGGGVVTAFCDGHQQFLDADINYRVYQHLMTPYSHAAYVEAGSDLNVAGVLDDAEF